ncbi:hypothetical protein [Pedobacter duraquae]|uniref:Lipoprotein n=1 Tax=Pedobacter duraquae TaxID=425511 RepID=A0A4R6INH7_9SPHI|nr:hypothetical protein [Pedobacter duraquae]TDO23763.1 hypothetical protein CLV32_0048 [Pedobacter duraquae]
MKRLLISILSIAITMLYSCTPKTPEKLAQTSCDCYKEARSMHNTTKQLRKMDECFSIVQANLERLQQLGIDNDWTPEQVQNARLKFDKIYNNCNGNTNSK